MNSRSSNTNSSAVDRDAEEQLLQHISALHARLSVSVEKLIAPLRDQIIAYKEVVAPLSQDLKKNLAVSWPLIEELQKQDGALLTSIGDLKDNISKVEHGIEALGSESQTSSEAVNQLSTRLDAISGAIQNVVENLETNRQSTSAVTDDILQQIVESQGQFTAAIAEFGGNQAKLRDDIESFTSGIQNEVAAVSQSVATLGDTTTSGLNDGFGALKTELDSGVAVISQAIASLGATTNTGAETEFEALKFEIQSGISMIYADIAKLRDGIAAGQSNDIENMQASLAGLQASVSGQLDQAAETLLALTTQIDALQTRDESAQVEETRAQISKLDWAVQSIGQNIAALGNKLASIQEDVASPPMARRTLKSIEDVDHQVGQILRALGHSQAASVSADQGDEAPQIVLEDVHAEITNTKTLLSEIGSQLTDALRYYSQGLRQAITEPSALLAGTNPATIPTGYEARLAALEAAALQHQGWLKGYDQTPPAPLAGYDGANALDQLKARDPVTFEHWIGPFQSGGAIYLEAQSDNCSTFSSTMARAFRDYLSLYAKGAILDIGCGPHASPAYLKGFPRNQVTGLEPLELAADPDFQVVRGVNEFLPWADNSFSTIVNATSIDHVMDLERSLEETHRVLSEDGVFVLWFGAVSGSPDYTKIAPADRVPVDSAHLFHISEDWFLPLIDRYFELVDIRYFPADPTTTDVFSVFRPRKTIRREKAEKDTGSPSKRTRRKTSKSTASKTKKPAAKKTKRAPSHSNAGQARAKRQVKSDDASS